MRVAWVFEGNEEDSARLWKQLPPCLRKVAVLTPTKDDRGDWVRFNYCGLQLNGIVVDGKARLSQGAFQYLLTRIREADTLFFELDDYHRGLAEDWVEALGVDYPEEAVRLARVMGVEYDPKVN